MLKTDVTIDELAKDVVNFLSKYIRVSMLILFGSYSYGSPREDSDFDIAVVSEDFEKMNVIDKIDLFSKVGLVVDSRIELKGFSRREFLSPSRGTLLEFIKDRGRIIYSV